MKRIFIFLLICVINTNQYAQSQTNYPIISPEKDYPISSLLNDYLTFYTTIESYSRKERELLPLDEFKRMFEAKAKAVIDFPVAGDMEDVKRSVPIKEGSAVNVEEYYDELINSVEKMQIYGFVQTASTKIIRCQQDGNWKVWVENTCKYHDPKSGNDALTMTSILRITFERSINNEYKITSITKDALPEDKDGDYIADNCDRCITKLSESEISPAISARGCELKSLYRKHASSKFGFTVSGGLISVLNNDIKQKDISTSNIVLKPGYFSKMGYMVDISGTYTFSAISALQVGCFYTRNAMDEDGMSKTINDFMAENNSGSVQNVKFYKTSKKLYTPYVGLRLGRFYKSKSIVSFEGILGLAIPTNSSNLFKYDVSFDSNNVEQSTFTSLFKAKPFAMYGARLTYEVGISKDDLARLVFNASYLTGKYSYSNGSTVTSGNQGQEGNQIILPTGNSILFEGSQVHMLNLSLGLFYNLFVPSIRKEQDRYMDLIKKNN